MYELAVVQPRDRQDWINGIRRAVDLSGGGSLAESSLEIEMEKVFTKDHIIHIPREWEMIMRIENRNGKGGKEKNKMIAIRKTGNK